MSRRFKNLKTVANSPGNIWRVRFQWNKTPNYKVKFKVKSNSNQRWNQITSGFRLGTQIREWIQKRFRESHGKKLADYLPGPSTLKWCFLSTTSKGYNTERSSNQQRNRLLYRNKTGRFLVDLLVSSIYFPVRHPVWLSFDFGGLLLWTNLATWHEKERFEVCQHNCLTQSTVTCSKLTWPSRELHVQT